MSIDERQERRVGIASLLTSLLGAVIAATTWLPSTSFFQLSACALIFVGAPAVVGIYTVMVPVEAWASRRSIWLGSVAAVVSNVVLVTVVYALVSSIGSGQVTLATPGFLLFAVAAALIWLISDRAFREVTANA